MKKLMLLLTGATLCGLTACNQPADKTTGNDGDNSKAAEMKARFKTLNNCFESGNTAAIDTLLSANAEDHTPDPDSHYPKGPAGLKQMIADMHTGSPDTKIDVKFTAVDGNTLMAYGTMSGTNSGPMMGMPATNKKWSADYCDVIKFDDKMKMTDHWGVYDNAKVMRDLGMMPAPGAAPPAMGKDTTKKKM